MSTLNSWLHAPPIPPGAPPTVPTPPTIPGPRPIPLFVHIGHLGRVSQWVAFVVFVVSTIIIAGLGSRISRKNRAFHVITSAITGIAALSYFAMATHGGASWVHQGHRVIQGKHAAVIRQVFWARYVDWALTTPLILLDLGLLAGLPWLDIISLMALDEAMVITSLIGSLTSRYKTMWGWYTFSCLFLIYIIYTLLWTGRKTSRLQPDHVTGLYTGLSILTVVIMLIYPVVFALSTATGIINPNIESLLYVILDICSKTVFGFWLVFIHNKGEDKEHTASFPDYWVEPRGHHRGIHLPGGDD